MSQNVGTIYYEVDANTAKLIEAAREANQALKSMGDSSKHVDGVTKSVNELGKEAQSSAAGLTKMQKALLSVATIGTAKYIGDLADEYRTVTERVRFATESQEEYEIVQKRLIQSANESYRSLEETSEVFIGTSDNLRSLGFTLDEALDITDSLSFAFVKNATSAEQARTAIRAYDNVLNRGKANSQAWFSINSAIPTLAQDIAKNLGITTQEVLNLGNAGELASSVINETLLKTFESNREAATGMATTINDALINLKTNFSVFVGEANKTAGATDLVAKSIDLVSNNLETLATLMVATGAGAVAKYVTQTGVLTVAKMKDTLATRANHVAELESAKAALDRARADVARTAALTAKVSGTQAHTKALGAEALAIARLSDAQKAVNATSRTFLSVLGGPAGIVGLLTMGVTAFAMFASSASEANVEITELKKPIEELTKEIENMTVAQREAAKITYEKEKEQAIKNLDKAYGKFISSVRDALVARDGSKERREALERYGLSINDILKELQHLKDKGEDAHEIMSMLSDGFGISEESLKNFKQQNGEISTLIVNVNELTEKYNTALGVIAEYSRETDKATLATERLRNELSAEVGKGLDKFTASLQAQMGTLKDGGSALKKYTRESEAEIKKLEDAGGKLTDEQKAQHESNKALAAAIDEKNKAMRGSRKEYNATSNTIREMQKELELAALSGKELAIARAEQRLNDFATEQEVQAVRNLASALYDLNQAKKFGETDQEITATITGQVNPLSGGAFDDQYARYEAEMIAEQERYEAQLERLREARELQLKTNEEFNDLEYDLQKTHSERMAQIEQAKNQVLLASYSSAFGSMADILKTAQGEQSSAYKTMFAVSQGFALAEAGLNISKALSQVLADPSAMTTAQKIANYGIIASEGAKILSGISNIAYGGGRQYGGPVAANKMYRINETGEPEIFNAGGRQYFLPNQKGEVVPAGKGGGGGMIFNPSITINMEATPGVDPMEQAKMVSDMVDAKLRKFAYNSKRPGGAFFKVGM